MVMRTVLFVMIWVGVLQFKLMRSSSKSADASAAFWARERKANFTRKKPLPVEDYIHIPIERLPFSDTQEEKERDLQDQLLTLSKENILNVSHMTNTDIKLTYGAGNFHLISAYDQNFLLLQRLLNQWGVLLYEHNQTEAAKIVLEYSVSISSDISSTYVTLASIYEKEQDYPAILDLIETVQKLQTLTKDALLQKLQDKLPIFP